MRPEIELLEAGDAPGFCSRDMGAYRWKETTVNKQRVAFNLAKVYNFYFQSKISNQLMLWLSDRFSHGMCASIVSIHIVQFIYFIIKYL